MRQSRLCVTAILNLAPSQELNLFSRLVTTTLPQPLVFDVSIPRPSHFLPSTLAYPHLSTPHLPNPHLLPMLPFAHSFAPARIFHLHPPASSRSCSEFPTTIPQRLLTCSRPPLVAPLSNGLRWSRGVRAAVGDIVLLHGGGAGRVSAAVGDKSDWVGHRGRVRCSLALLSPYVNLSSVSTLPCPTSLPPTYPLPHSSRPPLPPRPTPQASDILSAGKSSSLGDSRMAAPEDIVTRLAKLAISCTAMPTASRPSMLRVA
ncbi:unnamed protein product [Closterium sp. NIES-64]|nr:unnamed protein product [Closterium sp. NIES-64]